MPTAKGKRQVAAALAARTSTPRSQQGIGNHRHVEQIDRALLRGDSPGSIVKRYFGAELESGVAFDALKMRVTRYKNGPFAKTLKRAGQKRETRKADKVNKMVELAQQAYLGTVDLSFKAAEKDAWDAVPSLRKEAREDLMLLGRASGEMTGEPKEPAGVSIQNIIGLPRSGPLYADEYDDAEDGEAGVIDVE